MPGTRRKVVKTDPVEESEDSCDDDDKCKDEQQSGSASNKYQSEKRPAQWMFMLSGKLNIVVATVAFGLGIDIADVRLKSFVILAGGGEGRPGWETVPCSCLSLRSFVKGRLRVLSA
ncbi:hypothetical protein DPMN_025879 [Dreissena polymorpha]|uniref:Uncharacterized protein n=1 Tax=Dreissena polymorpha TaxID=45954 RepID=A0A9D4RC84_DREPO|nr:hypothetical protein DPMN_025879 [Dreissena polymorpha]